MVFRRYSNVDGDWSNDKEESKLGRDTNESIKISGTGGSWSRGHV